MLYSAHSRVLVATSVAVQACLVTVEPLLCASMLLIVGEILYEPLAYAIWEYRAACIFLSAFLFRYTRFLVGIYANATYQPFPVQEKPRYNAGDVTVVVPTAFKGPSELAMCLAAIVKCSPAKILVVTANANLTLVRDLCGIGRFRTVKIKGVEKLNKRDQMLRGLREVSTDIVVFADDDVFWPPNYLEYLLAVFDDPAVGAGGTRQRLRRSQCPNFWNMLGIAYLERRVWNNICTNSIDGSISTLSGRTAAYRAEILKNQEFSDYFTFDMWCGKRLNTDDDKCLTRYLFSHGWSIAIQTDPRAVIETTLEDDSMYVAQCMRWARAHWRGNLTVMTNETYWRSRRFLWGFLVIYVGQFQTPAIAVDGILCGLLWAAVRDLDADRRGWRFCGFVAWLLFTKTAKVIPHFRRHPRDLKFLPVLWLFGYLHGAINVYALFSLRNTLWGSLKLDALEKRRPEDDDAIQMPRAATRAIERYGGPDGGKVVDEATDYFSAVPQLLARGRSETV